MQAKYKKLKKNFENCSLELSEIYKNDKFSEQEKEMQSKLVLELLATKNSLLKTYEESVITLGQVTIKMSILLNGGAAVALMGLFSKISDKDIFFNSFAHTILDFSIGVMWSCLAAACTYVSRKLLIEDHYYFSVAFNVAAIFFVILSYVYFYYGICKFS